MMNADISEDPNREEEEFVFSEYAIDDTLDPLSRLVRYHQSDFSLQRLVLCRELCETAKFAGYQESVKTILPVLPHFISDSEPAVRQTLVSQLHPLAEFFVQEGGDAGYDHVLNTFLPMGFELLVDKNVDVGVVALETIQKLATLVHKEHVHTHLLNVVTTLAHDERAEDYRVVAAQLYNDLAPIFGPEFCTSVVLSELELLSNDNSFSVRKTVGGNIGGICAAVTDEVAKRTALSLYLGLCEDDIWGVRQSCAESVEKVSEALPEAMRLESLVPMYEKLLQDNNRWVRARAHEYLGHLLHTLPSEMISASLLQLYTDMAFQSDNTECASSEFCAFCFPAVVQVIGPARWAEVSDAYATMLKDVGWKVRKTLAYSLHELASILGGPLTEESLVPAFDLFLRDMDDIKLGVVLNVDQFLSIVSPATRDFLVTQLCQVPITSENWRLRNEVAKRIGSVAVLLDPQSPSLSAVLALVYRLLEDSVMEVRTSTYRPAAIILKHLANSSSPERYEEHLRTILDLAKKPSFLGRQMFAYVAEQAVLVGADGVLESTLLDNLVALASDRVDNVRLVLERVLRRTFIPSERWGQHPKVAQMMEELQRQDAVASLELAAAEEEEARLAAAQTAVPTHEGGPEGAGHGADPLPVVDEGLPPGVEREAMEAQLSGQNEEGQEEEAMMAL